MANTIRRSYRLNQDFLDGVKELSAVWSSPINPMTDTDVLREAIARCVKLERAKANQKKSKKSGE